MATEINEVFSDREPRQEIYKTRRFGVTVSIVKIVIMASHVIFPVCVLVDVLSLGCE